MAIITGSSDNDQLFGTSELDYIIGQQGDDQIFGGGGNDRLFGDSGDDQIFGDSGDDLIYGDAGNDQLTGGSGFDLLAGGAGNDTYFDEPQSIDNIIENFNEGIDTIVVDPRSDYFLPANVENLVLQGTFNNLLSFGNSEDNVMVGNDASNVLFGGAGDDTLLGNGGGDILNGGTGNDILTGGPGIDRFLFNTSAFFAGNEVGGNTITDFTPNFVGGVEFDLIVLDLTTFTALRSDPGPGFEVSSDFGIVASDDQAAISEAIIVYSSGTGNLFYNQNNNDPGFGSGAQFATVLTNNNPASLTAFDFTIQA